MLHDSEELLLLFGRQFVEDLVGLRDGGVVVPVVQQPGVWAFEQTELAVVTDVDIRAGLCAAVVKVLAAGRDVAVVSAVDVDVADRHVVDVPDSHRGVAVLSQAGAGLTGGDLVDVGRDGGLDWSRAAGAGHDGE